MLTFSNRSKALPGTRSLTNSLTLLFIPNQKIAITTKNLPSFAPSSEKNFAPMANLSATAIIKG